jgi:hypothetical protein
MQRLRVGHFWLPWTPGPEEATAGAVLVSLTDYEMRTFRDLLGIARAGRRLRQGWYGHRTRRARTHPRRFLIGRRAQSFGSGSITWLRVQGDVFQSVPRRPIAERKWSRRIRTLFWAATSESFLDFIVLLRATWSPNLNHVVQSHGTISRARS